MLEAKKTMEILNSNVTINVKDMDSAISFYLSIGFTLKQRWDNHYAQLTAPGIEIGLHPSNNVNKLDDQKALSIGFTTADFEMTKTELTQLGIPFNERSEEGGDFINFKDPDGTPLYFIKPKW